jgi:basic membrane protein A and related proteins
VKVRTFLPLVAAALIAVLMLALGAGTGSAKTDIKAAPAATTLKIALVTDVGGLDDKSFNFLANKGLQDVKNRLGVQGRVYISAKGSDYIPNLTSAARQYKADLVIGVGFLMGDATAKVAKSFPQTNFAIVAFPSGALKGKPTNVRGLIFAEEEAGYLAGVAAATVTKSNVIGSVGGQKIPPVDAYIAGYRQGAKATKKGITTLNGYSQEFQAQDKCKEIALNQIARRADVMFQVAGSCGLGALSAAKDKGVWGVGVDADQGYIGTHILTSAMKRVDLAVSQTVGLVKSGTYKGGTDTVFNVKNKGVSYGKISSKAPTTLKAKLEAVAKQIAAGKIKISRKV